MKKTIGYILLALFIAALLFGIVCIFRYAGGTGWLKSIGLTVVCAASSGGLLLILIGIVNLILGD